MLFHEVYGAYFLAVSDILSEALSGGLTKARMDAIVRERAFSESVLTILPALRSEEWLLLNRSLKTPIRHAPERPLTTLEKRWLKALLSDPRIRLFEPGTAGLEDVEPLFCADDFVYFDRCEDGDPYGDPAYQAHFRTILTALRERRRLSIRFRGGKGGELSCSVVPYTLEYSQKDDKFRLITAQTARSVTINLARVVSCALGEAYTEREAVPPRRRLMELTLELWDERNALERVMLHFSGYRKQTERIDANTYRMTLWFDAEDETELLIRILSFGPLIRVLSPNSLIAQIKTRLDQQLRCGL